MNPIMVFAKTLCQVGNEHSSVLPKSSRLRQREFDFTMALARMMLEHDKRGGSCRQSIKEEGGET